ncbi:hypothetical protein ACQV5M_19545, partial [Leptospira sp. SA-E8]|uniref:hypothetical protein n=1 Tax=Leptospira sp. SA-E8 TaxID=3422259 RepID=UPI003EBFEA5D
QAASRTRTVDARDFQLRGNFPALAEPRRNLFAAQASDPSSFSDREADAARTARRNARVAQVETGASPASPVTEVAASPLQRLRLLGVVFRDGRGQIYLGLDGRNLIAFEGDTVFGQFSVVRIAVDAVELRELQTQAQRKIPVQGR